MKTKLLRYIPLILVIIFAVVLWVSLDNNDKENPESIVRDISLKGEKFTYENYTEVYGRLRGLQAGSPEVKTIDDLYKQKEEFDVNSYFDIFTHISIKEGCYMDYIYWSESLGSQPQIIFGVGEKPFIEYSDFCTQDSYYIQYDHGENNKYKYQDEFEAIKFVELDGSKEGYVEFALLTMMGSQFNRVWHAMYHDHTILLNKEVLESMPYQPLGNTDRVLTTAQKKAAAELDTNIYFKETPGKLEMTLLFFTKWGGYSYRTYVFKTGNEIELVEIIDKNVIPYDCRIMF